VPVKIPKVKAKAKKPALPVKRARAARVAKAVVAGVDVPAIAASEGVSRQTIYKTLRADDCRQIVIAFVNREIGLFNTLFLGALQAVAEALAADRPDQRDSKGNVTLGGPDHYARMTAVARLTKLMTSGRPTALVPDNRKPGSLLLPQEALFERDHSVSAPGPAEVAR
jgi:hypothetical protein